MRKMECGKFWCNIRSIFSSRKVVKYQRCLPKGIMQTPSLKSLSTWLGNLVLLDLFRAKVAVDDFWRTLQIHAILCVDFYLLVKIHICMYIFTEIVTGEPKHFKKLMPEKVKFIVSCNDAVTQINNFKILGVQIFWGNTQDDLRADHCSSSRPIEGHNLPSSKAVPALSFFSAIVSCWLICGHPFGLREVKVVLHKLRIKCLLACTDTRLITPFTQVLSL